MNPAFSASLLDAAGGSIPLALAGILVPFLVGGLVEVLRRHGHLPLSLQVGGRIVFSHGVGHVAAAAPRHRPGLFARGDESCLFCGGGFCCRGRGVEGVR